MASLKKVPNKNKSKPSVKPKSKAKPVSKAKNTQKIAKKPIKTSKLNVPKTPYKQSEFFNVLAEQTSVGKKDIKAVLESIKSIIKIHLSKNGPGQFTLPGLLKITLNSKPATKARRGRNPFTGEEIMIKAKPARKVVKVKALKKFRMEIE